MPQWGAQQWVMLAGSCAPRPGSLGTPVGAAGTGIATTALGPWQKSCREPGGLWLMQALGPAPLLSLGEG